MKTAIILFAVTAVLLSACGPAEPQKVVATNTPSVAKPPAVATTVPTPTTPPKPALPPTLAPPPSPAASPTLPPPPTPVVPPAGKVGEKVKSGDYVISVNKVENPYKPTGQLASKPKEGNKYVAVDVTVENAGTKPIAYNPMYFRLKDSEGFEEGSALVFGLENSLMSGDLPPGDKVRGWVAFEVKQGSKGLQLIHSPIVLGASSKITINID